MTISGPDTTTANNAIAALNAAMATHATKGNPTAQDLYAGETILPLINAAAPLACSLGRELLAEQIAAAKDALAPFVANTVERDQVAYALSGPMTLRGWVNGLATSAGAAPSEAISNARLVVSIFTKCLAAAA